MVILWITGLERGHSFYVKGQYIEIEIGGLNKELQSYNQAMYVGNTLTNLKM